MNRELLAIPQFINKGKKMHKTALEVMTKLIKVEKTILKKGKVLDVGSMDVNGSYKDLFNGWAYLGCDIRKGKNVDIFMQDEFKIPLNSNEFDLVISGSCLEHCRNPFKLVDEMARVVKPQCDIIINAPFIWHSHDHPIDCFRYLPDGFDALFEQSRFKFYSVRTWLQGNTCFGIAQKE